MLRIRLLLLFTLTAACLSMGIAHAARTFTNVQSPPAGTNLDMGSIQTLTYLITNTASGGNAGERIYEMRFRINSGSLFSASTAAPAGWTRSAFSTTSVSFRATSWVNAIPAGGSLSFALVIAMRTTTADVNERLRDMRARFTTTTTGPPFNPIGKSTTTNPGSWTLKSLAITSFQITDTSGVPITAQTAGNPFQVRMTVRNNSSVAQNPVVSNANPPAGTWTGTGPSPTCTAGGSLSLASGASGTIIFNCTSVATASGTVFFTAIAQRGGTVTSATAVSTVLAISRFIVSITTSAPVSSCLYSGASLTVTMTVANNTGSTITAITGSLTPIAGAPVSYISGPTPASIASMATATTATITWIYTINSTGLTNPFTFSGSATGTSGVPLTTPTATSAAVTRGAFAVSVNPTSTNAGSTNTELSFNVTNSGCASVNSVAVTAPAGWTFGNDTYSLVNLSAVNAIETWTTGGSNPVAFTAPNLAGQMPQTFSGSFSLVYAATPPSATTSIFTLRVTDANGSFVDVPVNITVNAFKTGTLNNATNKIWREDFR